jgi:predicted lactoylglutathione lyase
MIPESIREEYTASIELLNETANLHDVWKEVYMRGREHAGITDELTEKDLVIGPQVLYSGIYRALDNYRLAKENVVVLEAKREGLLKQIAEYNHYVDVQTHVREWMHHILDFDSTRHVETEYHEPDEPDEDRNPKRVAEINHGMLEGNTIEQLIYPRTFPLEFGVNFDRFYRDHHDEISEVTRNYYPYKENITCMLNIMNVHEPDGPKTALEVAEDWVRRNKTKFTMDIAHSYEGKWAVLGDWKANRRAEERYTKDHRIVNAILAEQTRTKEACQEIEKHRIRMKRRTMGQDKHTDRIVKEYTDNMGPSSGLRSMGVNNCEDIDEFVAKQPYIEGTTKRKSKYVDESMPSTYFESVDDSLAHAGLTYIDGGVTRQYEIEHVEGPSSECVPGNLPDLTPGAPPAGAASFTR